MQSRSADETVLLARARSRDSAAFNELVSRHQGTLERILLPMAGSRDQARDWAQDAVLRAYRNLHHFRDGHRFSSWFFRIGVNRAISALRRERLDRRAREEAAAAEETISPVERVLEAEDRERLAAAIGELSARYRNILELRYVRGLSCQEIAARLETTPNTISIVLFRAKQKLREMLEE